MEKFKVITVEDDDDFWFVLGRESEVGVAFNIRFRSHAKKWNF